LHSLNQGITVADSNQNLVAWNARFADLYQIPAGYLYVGQSSKKVIEFIANSGGYGDGDRNILVNRRLQEIIKRQPLHYVRETSDGRYIELNGIPIGADLYVTVYTDITSHRLIESQLRSANEVLEDRVEERTQKLLQLNRDLQKANTNKTRFLAAAGHDLVQPMNSASLFSASIINKLEKQAAGYPDVVNPVLDVARHLDQSLNSAESLLSELLEISKLDAELIKPNIRELPLSELLDSLIREFRPLVEKKSLENRQASEGALTLSSVSSRLQIKTDPVLLRRILQNLLANALRYTHSGKILIGVRRRNKHAEIQVWDTGIGIKPDQHLLIFDEFHRVSES
ncbi:MAG: PAS-domain containing protein, partial [Oceanobacter sp.]